MHLKSTLITHRVLIRSWFLMTALGLSPPSSHHRAQADHHVAQSKALDSLPTSRNNHSHASAPQDTGINSAALRLSTALRLNRFSARACISLWKFLGQRPPGHCESPGEGERKEKTSPRQILPCLCSKILDSSAVSQALQLSLHLTFFISHFSSHCSFLIMQMIARGGALPLIHRLPLFYGECIFLQRALPPAGLLAL